MRQFLFVFLIVLFNFLGSACHQKPSLFGAIRDGNISLVTQLISQGIDVNATQKDGGTALMVASQDGHTEIVKILLAAGAKVNATAKVCYTCSSLFNYNICRLSIQFKA